MSCGLVKAQPEGQSFTYITVLILTLNELRSGESPTQRSELTYITVLIREDAEVRYGESPHPKTSAYLHRGAIITPLKESTRRNYSTTGWFCKT
jgi:hypothetical protein